MGTGRSGRPASSPLDTINTPSWTRYFNDDLLNLLHVLGQIVQLEPAQDVLLKDVCSNPVIDTLQLREAGVLPVPAPARAPKQQSPTTDQLAI
jgi:hypothetical protein